MPTSAHTRGYAVDIRCVDSHSRFVMLQALLEAGFRRVELAPTWIHVDNDPDKPRDVAFYQHGGAVLMEAAVIDFHLFGTGRASPRSTPTRRGLPSP